MKILTFIILLLCIEANSQSFLKYPRVKKAYSEKKDYLTELLKEKNLSLNDLNILIIVYKWEKELEVWAKSTKAVTYNLLITYPICATSGDLGPKRCQGDGQIPEGFYFITTFNPYSSFYLSLGINYPNASDKILSTCKDPGSDIFIHGSCVTIGCIPITDDKIKELYLLAAFANEAGQKRIPVYIFPFRMNEENFLFFTENLEYRPFKNFWKNLKIAYQLFHKSHKELKYTINKQGEYVIF